MNRERLNRGDWLLIASCLAIAAISIFVVVNWFSAAFPEASIEFRYDRDSSQQIAARVLAAQHIDTLGMKHSATFDSDDEARIFLERSVGLRQTNEILKRDVRVWAWSHRWFRPLQEEEFHVDVAPTGEVTGFSDRIPEDRAIASPDVAGARRIAEGFLGSVGANLADLQLVSQSERRLPRRMQRIFTWESHTIHPAGAPYRTVVTVDGDRVSSFSSRVKVPEDWQRSYRELRSKNLLAGNVDTVFFIITGICIVAVFVTRLLRGDLQLRLLLGIGIAAIILVTGTALNSCPERAGRLQHDRVVSGLSVQLRHLLHSPSGRRDGDVARGRRRRRRSHVPRAPAETTLRRAHLEPPRPHLETRLPRLRPRLHARGVLHGLSGGVLPDRRQVRRVGTGRGAL